MSYPCPFCKRSGKGGVKHSCSTMGKMCLVCGEPYEVTALLAAIKSGKRPRCPCRRPKPGEPTSLRRSIADDGRLATVLANIVYRWSDFVVER